MYTSNDWGKLKAYVTVTFTNGLIVKCKVVNGIRGLFVGMPSVLGKNKETGEDEWSNLCYFNNEDDQKAFSDAILEDYNQRIQKYSPSNNNSNSYANKGKTDYYKDNDDDVPF
jgi:DNA-binding cell septation regulator SpoVG